MSTVNAFSLGPCTVGVAAGENPVGYFFSQVMGLSSSADVTDPTYGLDLIVAVDADGNVSLSTAAVINPPAGGVYRVVVAPSSLQPFPSFAADIVLPNTGAGVDIATGLVDLHFSADSLTSVNPPLPNPLAIGNGTADPNNIGLYVRWLGV